MLVFVTDVHFEISFIQFTNKLNTDFKINIHGCLLKQTAAKTSTMDYSSHFC